jgi:hypothetical protein
MSLKNAAKPRSNKVKNWSCKKGNVSQATLFRKLRKTLMTLKITQG